MKALVTLCFMALLGLVLVEGGGGPCGCRRVFDFCANDYETYHSICEYKCKHPSTPFKEWYMLYHGPCQGQPTEAKMETTTTTDLPATSVRTYRAIPGYVWEPSTGSRYKVHTAAETWRSAKATCEAEGGYLAIINSWTESNFLKDLFNQNSLSMITGTEDKFKYYASVGFRQVKRSPRLVTISGLMANTSTGRYRSAAPCTGMDCSPLSLATQTGTPSSARLDTNSNIIYHLDSVAVMVLLFTLITVKSNSR